MASTPVQDRRLHLARDTLRYRRWSILILAALGLAGGLSLMLRGGEVYTSNAQVLVNPIVGNAFSPDGGSDALESMASEAQVVISDAVVENAAADLDLDPDSRLLTSAVSVNVVPNTQVLQITVSGVRGDLVREVADAMGENYLDVREQLAVDLVQTRTDRLEAQIADTETNLEEATRKANAATTSGEEALQERLADGYQTDLFNQRTALTEVLNTDTEPGRVVSPAVAARTEAPARTLLPPIAGTIAGGLLGLVVGLVRERGKDLVRGATGVSDLGVPVLGEFTKRTTSDPKALNEAMRVARLHALEQVDRPAVLVVAGVAAPADTSRLAGGLSLAFARVPAPTTLVQATEVQLLGTSASGLETVAGLSEAVLDGRDPVELLLPVEQNLVFLPTGRDLPRAYERFVPELLGPVLDQLRKDDRLVVVQSPSLSQAEGEALASVADAVILVVTRHRHTFAEVERAVVMLADRRIPLAGAVIVDPDQPRLDEWAGRTSVPAGRD